MDCPTPTMSQRAQATAANYRGETARRYEAKRIAQEKWAAEHSILASWLSGYPLGSTVLDIPFGTGRFEPIYRGAGFRVIGRDISEDMLSEARKRCAPGWDIGTGNVLAIDLPNAAVDVAVCIRLLNMLEPAETARALGELQRVARKTVIVSLRVGGDEGRLTRPCDVSEVANALAPGWRLDEDRAIHKPRYRMIRLARV
jgi:ubiquinone/menaquinone biosynthesis C-methylase UbiE